MSSSRTEPPPIDSGLKLRCSGDSSATQKRGRADAQL